MHLETLQKWGYHILPPVCKTLACQEVSVFCSLSLLLSLSCSPHTCISHTYILALSLLLSLFPRLPRRFCLFISASLRLYFDALVPFRCSASVFRCSASVFRCSSAILGFFSKVLVKDTQGSLVTERFSCLLSLKGSLVSKVLLSLKGSLLSCPHSTMPPACADGQGSASVGERYCGCC